MNLIDILKSRILTEFPDITPEELETRVNYAYELMKYIRD